MPLTWANVVSEGRVEPYAHQRVGLAYLSPGRADDPTPPFSISRWFSPRTDASPLAAPVRAIRGPNVMYAEDNVYDPESYPHRQVGRSSPVVNGTRQKSSA